MKPSFLQNLAWSFLVLKLLHPDFRKRRNYMSMEKLNVSVTQ